MDKPIDTSNTGELREGNIRIMIIPPPNKVPTKELKQIESGTYEVGNKKPPVHSQFTSDKQPSKEVREQSGAKISATKNKNKQRREILQAMLDGKFKFNFGSEVKKQLDAVFGADMVSGMTIAETVYAKMIVQAVLKNDNRSQENVLKYGGIMPKQELELSDPDGNAINFGSPTTVIIENPHARNKERKTE